MLAKMLGYSMFAVQDGGQCFSSSSTTKDYFKYGESSNCVGLGKGGPLANDVYEIVYDIKHLRKPRRVNGRFWFLLKFKFINGCP